MLVVSHAIAMPDTWNHPLMNIGLSRLRLAVVCGCWNMVLKTKYCN